MKFEELKKIGKENGFDIDVIKEFNTIRIEIWDDEASVEGDPKITEIYFEKGEESLLFPEVAKNVSKGGKYFNERE